MVVGIGGLTQTRIDWLDVCASSPDEVGGRKVGISIAAGTTIQCHPEINDF